MELQMWINYKPLGKDYSFNHDITNPDEIYPKLHEIKEFHIKGLGKLAVRDIRKYPSDMHKNLVYVSIMCDYKGIMI